MQRSFPLLTDQNTYHLSCSVSNFSIKPCLLSCFTMYIGFSLICLFFQVCNVNCSGSPCNTVRVHFVYCPGSIPGSLCILSGFTLYTVRVHPIYCPGSPYILSGFNLYTVRVHPEYCRNPSKSIYLILFCYLTTEQVLQKYSYLLFLFLFSSCYSSYNLIMHHNYTLNSICYQKKARIMTCVI